MELELRIRYKQKRGRKKAELFSVFFLVLVVYLWEAKGGGWWQAGRRIREAQGFFLLCCALCTWYLVLSSLSLSALFGVGVGVGVGIVGGKGGREDQNNGLDWIESDEWIKLSRRRKDERGFSIHLCSLLLVLSCLVLSITSYGARVF